MNNQKLIIYEFDELYKILIEINNDVNLIIKKASINDISDFISQPNILVLTHTKISGFDNQIIFNDFPVSILKLLEIINTEFLKINFNKQSDIMIGSYRFNLNSREMSQSDLKLKLTEKEINSIFYLFNSKDVVKINELQSKVWGYQPELETNNVQTHIYRLRKKILKKFNDDSFILTNKSGYQIVKKK
jgi:DNA-binding response OmpR family regulator